MARKQRSDSGFTLIELLVVLVILVVLFGVFFVIFSPEKRVSEARNAQRFEEIRSIAGAFSTYEVDHSGATPEGVDTTLRMLGTSQEGCDTECGVLEEKTENACLNLEAPFVGNYFGRIPYDPLHGSREKTYYAVKKTEADQVFVVACRPELGEHMAVER
ncbi:prepilin-type N-terminal cleavage/methylation domain-containing protein [Patescibacteria group bacterium]|nr:prepilin-type N-terminal cleavage/methylation domain-containing protein [Patescibacteria group bacterium]